MSEQNTDAVQQILTSVLASKKYRALDAGLIRAIAAAELAKGRSLKEAVKATKNQLHQSVAAYQVGRMDYTGWLEALRQVYRQLDEAVRRQQLRSILAHHASTAERLPILDVFYATLFARLPVIHSVLDVACGLNPLTHAWMPLPPGARYFASDVYSDQVHFLNQYFQIAGLHGQAEVRDLLRDPPARRVDLALVLKTLPCLEQMDRQAGARLLDALNARYLLVSYPVRSLGGRAKGMSTTYADHFQALVAGRDWRVTRFDFAGELVFLAETGLAA